MRKREQQDEKLMYEIAQENKRMSEPLRKARQVRCTLPSNMVRTANAPTRTPGGQAQQSGSECFRRSLMDGDTVGRLGRHGCESEHPVHEIH